MTLSSSSSRPQHFFFSFFFVFFFFVPFLSLAQDIDIDGPVWDFPSRQLCSSPQSDFTNSKFSNNLKSLVSSISSLDSNTFNFYNLSFGSISDPDRVEAIGSCNRVLTKSNCLNCISEAAKNLTMLCPNNREAYLRATKCMFRYSDKPIFGKLEKEPSMEAPNPNNATGNRTEFIRLQRELLNKLRLDAASGGSKRKYAQGTALGSPANTTFFASVQCTPDLSEKDCNDCLKYGFGNAAKGRLGIRWFCPSCNFQIESNLRFFRLDSEYQPDQPTNSLTKQDQTDSGKRREKSKSIIATVGSIVGFVIIVVCLYFLLTRNRRKARKILKDDEDSKIKGAQLLQIDFDTIKLATNDFSPDNHLGEGGFGAVYKGVLDNGDEVAVKRLSMKSEQGDNEFINEVTLVAKLQHRNLVRLLGFCLDRKEQLLIFEFFKNTSLDNFIFDTNRRTILAWETRYKIISGVAKGLLYLHEDSRFKIIHRDLKSSNVLLDDEMNPKIADFGLAKLFDTNQISHTRFTNRIAGTYGYMAPEYAMNGQFSVKTDVYSFGVLVIEIITGKKNNWSPDEESSLYLLSYVWRQWREGKVLNIVDPSLIETRGLSEEIMKCIHIGLLCVQDKAENRPTMASLVLMLNAASHTLPKPLQPAFYPGDGESSSSRVIQLSSTEPTMSLNSVTISDLGPR